VLYQNLSALFSNHLTEYKLYLYAITKKLVCNQIGNQVKGITFNIYRNIPEKWANLYSVKGDILTNSTFLKPA